MTNNLGHRRTYRLRPLGNVHSDTPAALARRVVDRIANLSYPQALVWIAPDGGVIVSPEGSVSSLGANADNTVGYYVIPKRYRGTGAYVADLAADIAAAAEPFLHRGQVAA